MQSGSDVIYSSSTDNWETPQPLFDKLNREFHFGIDVCASEQNRKCKNFFDKKTDGLKQKWGGLWNNLVQSSIRQGNRPLG